ncbi:MAG: hypothetical protein CUN49_10640 [Candidatus Thermofonsia Clade 1 bacterium]|uniref:Uncharacterized protein n=1 Tax=Candidatus Thermofonsia Clade 1 bacterium TaxID=2364210 RepID=A0A2M8PCZ9_9CHLR|nr:MAG: hypothetical protein CUN49_10640 [Candidatus Thermofonsia Clade 1 bacterium]RMF52478.1 MAG: hypothetical protein D6749_04815 [Chloroflexota bacterium]
MAATGSGVMDGKTGEGSGVSLGNSVWEGVGVMVAVAVAVGVRLGVGVGTKVWAGGRIRISKGVGVGKLSGALLHALSNSNSERA